jgi:hypothetical protein
MSDFGDYNGEMSIFDELSDERLRRILEGTDLPDEDLAVAAFLAKVRSIGSSPLPGDLADRHIAMLVEARRLGSPMAQPSGEITPTRKVPMFTTLKRRLATRAAAVSMATLLLGAAVAGAATGNFPGQDAVSNAFAQAGIDIANLDGDLPDPAGAGQDTAAENKAAAEEMAANAEAFTSAVAETIDQYTAALDEWTTCVGENAASRGTTQSDEATRSEDPFDPTEGCDPRPVLVIPDPADFGLTGPDGEGKPEDVGQPEGVGRPEGVGQPEDVGQPEGVGQPGDLP